MRRFAHAILCCLVLHQAGLAAIHCDGWLWGEQQMACCERDGADCSDALLSDTCCFKDRPDQQPGDVPYLLARDSLRLHAQQPFLVPAALSASQFTSASSFERALRRRPPVSAFLQASVLRI